MDSVENRYLWVSPEDGKEYWYMPTVPQADDEYWAKSPRLIVQHSTSGLKVQRVTSSDIHAGYVIGIFV